MGRRLKAKPKKPVRKAPRPPPAVPDAVAVVIAPSPAVAAPVEGPAVKRGGGHNPLGVGLVPGAGRGCAKGAPNAGRPPGAWREHARTILDEDGAAAAREILRGEPDKAGRVPDQGLRMRLIEKLTAIGFNETMRTERLRAQAAADGGSKATAGVQIIMQGGPAGNLQPT